MCLNALEMLSPLYRYDQDPEVDSGQAKGCILDSLTSGASDNCLNIGGKNVLQNGFKQTAKPVFPSSM